RSPAPPPFPSTPLFRPPQLTGSGPTGSTPPAPVEQPARSAATAGQPWTAADIPDFVDPVTNPYHPGAGLPPGYLADRERTLELRSEEHTSELQSLTNIV